MPRKNSDESQVVFIDAPAHFSKEEWKLLEEWQKDLYRNVMKEIHQALMSLGPLIASTVCSLRDKEREEIYHRDSQLSERRSKINRLTSDRMKDSSVLFRTSNTQSLHLNNTQDWEEKETADCPVTEFPFIDAETGLSKEEPVPIFIDHLGLEITENGTNPNSGASCNIKEEEDCYYMEQTDSRHAESLGCFTDNEGNNRQKKVQDSIKYSEKPVSSRAFSRKYNTKVPQSSVKEQISKSQVLSEYFQELIEEKATQSESSFSRPLHFRGSPSSGRSDKYLKYKSTLSNAEFPADFPNLNQGTYSHTEWNKSYSLFREHTGHMSSDSRARPYACTECDKSFFVKSHLITHHRTHSGEKPYTCSFCHKSFNRKDNLNGHVRIHTGERPYKCTKCEKHFRRKSDLNLHRKKHTPCKTTTVAICETGPTEMN
ncbi:zinc finger protein 282-like [Pleurodeles waltl]|uniref:zinc finger protein 282-like n=1 Tax=Pleurodeles waltl TaxID=8319 RepID=UPI0037098DCA